jgi:hypothetical protein
MTRRQQLDEIRQLIAAYGFCARDFLLTAPRARGYARERTRRRIARQLHSLGCSAHDLVEVTKISAPSFPLALPAPPAERTTARRNRRMEMEDDFDTTTTTTTTTNGDGGTIVPAQPRINPFALFRQRNSGGGGFFRGDLLKCDYRTGEWLRVRGENETQIDPDERFIVNPHEMIDAWTKFIDGKRVAQKVYRTIDGEMAPEREELGDKTKVNGRHETADPKTRGHAPCICQ